MVRREGGWEWRWMCGKEKGNHRNCLLSREKWVGEAKGRGSEQNSQVERPWWSPCPRPVWAHHVLAGLHLSGRAPIDCLADEFYQRALGWHSDGVSSQDATWPPAGCKASVRLQRNSQYSEWWLWRSQVCFQNSMFLVLLGPKILYENTNLRKKGASEMDVRWKEGGI